MSAGRKAGDTGRRGTVRRSRRAKRRVSEETTPTIEPLHDYTPIAMAVEGVIAEELFDLISDDSTFLNDMRGELERLLTEPTAKQRLLKERALLYPEESYIDICTMGTLEQCLERPNADCYNKIHFEPLKAANTDYSLGDCSYLDTCYKAKGCKYRHYRIRYPEGYESGGVQNGGQQVTNFLSALSIPEPEVPSQWICCDIRQLDLKVLGNFAVIIADPPWDIHMNGHVQLPYGVISDEEMLSFNIPDIQTEGIFFLWVTGRAIDTGRQCLKRWGFDHIEEIIWCKTNQLARTICTGRTGHWLNHSKEHVLLGVKGNPKWLARGINTDVIVSATRDKSHKPDELYRIAERLAGTRSRKLELFGRDHNTRPGWITVGNQLNGTRILEPALAQRYEQWLARSNT